MKKHTFYMAFALMLSGLLIVGGKSASAQTVKYLSNAQVDLSVNDPLFGSYVMATTQSDSNGEFIFDLFSVDNYTITVKDPSNGTVIVDEAHTPSSLTIHGRITSADGGLTWFIDYDPAPIEEPVDAVLQNPEQTKKAHDIAAAAGVSVNKVVEMRQSGMGWGEIAEELGVDPSVAGKGKGKGKGK